MLVIRHMLAGWAAKARDECALGPCLPALVWVFDGLDIAAAKNSSLESIPCIGHACADSILSMSLARIISDLPSAESAPSAESTRCAESSKIVTKIRCENTTQKCTKKLTPTPRYM